MTESVHEQPAEEAFSWDPDYTACPLDKEKKEIRILLVSTNAFSNGDSHLLIEICKISLLNRSRPAYKALSYVWSDPRSPGKLLNSCLVATNPKQENS